jgi:hypothetical protein
MTFFTFLHHQKHKKMFFPANQAVAHGANPAAHHTIAHCYIILETVAGT